MKKPQTDFLTCKAYYGHEPDQEDQYYVKFQKGKLFYFGLIDDQERLLLRGKATKTATQRETRIDTVNSYLERPEAYSILRKGNSFFVALSSKNHEPIAISCKLRSRKQATALLNKLSGQSVSAPENDEHKKSKKKKSNSFLTCAKHKGHDRLKEFPLVSFFTHNNKRYCFSIHNEDGFVLVRSRRYKTEEDRQVGFELVNQMMADKNHWEKVTQKKYAFLKLKDSSGKTIGKSCRFLDVDFNSSWLQATPASIATVAEVADTPIEKVVVDESRETVILKEEDVNTSQLAVGAAASTLLLETTKEEVVAPEIEKKVIEETVTNAEAVTSVIAPEVAYESENDRGGFNWWWLLALLPLLLFMLLLKNCMAEDEKVVQAPIVEKVAEVPAPIEAPIVAESFALEPIFFGFDSAELTAEAKVKLDDLIRILQEHSQFNTQIYAHTDSKGSKVYNENLSKNRASNTVEYLIEKGVDSRRISFKVFGEDDPVAKNTLDSGADTEEGRKYNRRVELAIVDGNEVVKSETIVVPEGLDAQ